MPRNEEIVVVSSVNELLAFNSSGRMVIIGAALAYVSTLLGMKDPDSRHFHSFRDDEQDNSKGFTILEEDQAFMILDWWKIKNNS